MSDQSTSQPTQGSVLPYAPGAVASLVLGIVGTVFGFCYGIGLVPSIIGLVFGVKARKAIQAGSSQYQSPGIGTAGFVLSIIGIVASAIGIIILVVVIIAVIATGTSGRFPY